jgi:hypothetical protein
LLEVVGEVAEWFKAPLSKSGSPERRRGFESHPLRHAPRRKFSDMFEVNSSEIKGVLNEVTNLLRTPNKELLTLI